MIHPAVSLSLTSKTNAHVAGVMSSSVCLARASKDLYDSRHLCHYRFCPKGALESTKTESSSLSHFKSTSFKLFYMANEPNG